MSSAAGASSTWIRWGSSRRPGSAAARRSSWPRGTSTRRWSTCCGSSASTRSYVSARGSYLYDAGGRAYLDLHTGEGFASLGHNHPDVRAVLQAALGEDLLDGVQIHYSALAGMLARGARRRACRRGLDALFFASTGAEAVDAAMKFARAATGRTRFVSCQSSFHGVTLGPLSIVGDEFFKEGFGPLLPGCELVPFGDLERLEAQLRRGDVAAFVVEPIQGRTVAPAPAGYLRAAQELCRRYGTMFVLDEIQTGLGRTGRWFALDEWGLEPDFVLVGKALSGGCMPVAAMATTRDIYQRAVGTLERSYVHQSTYGRNRLSMAAGLATIRIIERDGLVERSAQVGALLRDGAGRAAGASRDHQGGPRPRPDDRDRAGRAPGQRRARSAGAWCGWRPRASTPS